MTDTFAVKASSCLMPVLRCRSARCSIRFCARRAPPPDPRDRGIVAGPVLFGSTAFGIPALEIATPAPSLVRGLAN